MKNKKHLFLKSIVDNLYSEEEFNDFFQDILTNQEYDNLVDRFLICQELQKGETVLSISKKLDVASATVVRGNKIIKYGTGQLKKLTSPKEIPLALPLISRNKTGFSLKRIKNK